MVITLFYPSRIDTDFGKSDGQIAVDQLKCFDKARLEKILGLFL